MTWLLPILRHRVTWGVGIAVGVLVAIGAHGALRYRDGFAAGVAERDAQAQTDALIASRAADSAWAVLYAQAADARDAERNALARAARAEARSRVASARVANALRVFAADTAAQMEPACAGLATACELAAALWDAERDSLTAVVAASDTIVRRQSAMLATEHTRTRTEVQAALLTQRLTYRAPSRLRWLLTGAALPLAWLVIR